MAAEAADRLGQDANYWTTGFGPVLARSTQDVLGDEAAGPHWREAYEVFADVGVPGGAEIRALLAEDERLAAGAHRRGTR